MKTKYKYIHFVETRLLSQTSIYECRNNKSGETIAKIKWYSVWVQYCFFPEQFSVYNLGCLNDIANFMEQLKELR